MTNSEQVLSDRAVRLRSLVEGFDSFPETCDGGDPGTPENPSIWLFGIEPGWSVADEQKDEKEDLAAAKAFQDYTVEMQLGIPFNRNAFGFLAALKGMDPRAYAQFARSELPFENGSTGYLKGNLFPAACNNLGKWGDAHIKETGFASKLEYQNWMREKRLPIVQAWIKQCQPKLLICVGTTYLNDFLNVTETANPTEPHDFSINGHSKKMYVSTGGNVPIAIIPHLTGGPHGLNSYASRAAAAKYIRESMPEIQF